MNGKDLLFGMTTIQDSFLAETEELPKNQKFIIPLFTFRSQAFP